MITWPKLDKLKTFPSNRNLIKKNHANPFSLIETISDKIPATFDNQVFHNVEKNFMLWSWIIDTKDKLNKRRQRQRPSCAQISGLNCSWDSATLSVTRFLKIWKSKWIPKTNLCHIPCKNYVSHPLPRQDRMFQES